MLSNDKVLWSELSSSFTAEGFLYYKTDNVSYIFIENCGLDIYNIKTKSQMISEIEIKKVCFYPENTSHNS